ncbi:MAG: hypothetical protein FWF05_06765 [Oscillospiraceae bacterium]|nr:hypothetical protein [Oscillospiraceae bacterium]
MSNCADSFPNVKIKSAPSLADECRQLRESVEALTRENELLRGIIGDAIGCIAARNEAARSASAEDKSALKADSNPFSLLDQRKREAEEAEQTRKDFLAMFQKTHREMDELYASINRLIN